MSGNPFPKTISKEAVNDMPLIRFDGRIHLVTNHAEMQQAIQQLGQEHVLGFDTETRPCFRKGESRPVALLQLSRQDDAYLFRLNQMPLDQELIAILENPAITKIGVAIQDDLKALRELAEFKPAGFLDLARLAKTLKLQKTGLRNLTAIFLNKRITKGPQVSNWEQNPLSEAQLCYAATDAWVAREIYLKMHQFKLV